MLKINMFTLCLLLVWSVGFSSNLNMKFSPNNRIIYFKYPFYKNSFSPDIGIWVTQRFFMHLLPQVIDTLDIAQVEFDSSNFGLDADTCWIDNLVMNKVGDSLTGFYYMLFEENGFLYNLNHRYTFRVKGKGNIPSLTDTMRSVINSLSVIAPQANDIIYRGKELIIHWTPSNEHNILIELIDFNYNMLFYYPVLDIGSFTIPSADIDSLNTGPIIFCIGRLNFKMEFFPGFPLFAITALIHQIPLELQEIPAIAENANSDQHIRFMAPTGKSYITYNFSKPLSIHLTIYDIRGNKLREIMKPASTNGTIFWDRNNSNSQSVSRGIYFYNLKIDKATYRGKFVIVK